MRSNGFSFASEIKALKVLSGTVGSHDALAIESYLNFMVPRGADAVKGCKKIGAR